MPPDLVPVETQPEFDHSLEPVDYDPFAAEKYVNPLVSGAIDSTAKFVSTPGTLASTPNPYPPGSEEGIEFERTRQNAGQDWVRNAALSTMGTGAIAGAPVNAGEAVLGAGPIRAYHGSPHDFDAFSMDKIGTGEGAQAYGHGLYFAENEGTAKAYRDALSGDNIEAFNYWDKNAGKFADMPSKFSAAANAAKEVGGLHPDNAKAIANNIQHGIMDGTPAERYTQEYDIGDPKLKPAYEAAAKHFEGVEYKNNPGKMYQVDINADPEHFLDWDKPLTEQSPTVKGAVQQAMGPNWDQFKFAKAGDAVKRGFIAPGEETTAARLNQSGIPGIKYLDQGSRAAGDGSRNYVVFNDKLIDIVKKYGLAAIAGLPPALQAMARSNLVPVDHNPFEGE